jgi:hypothetical protein
LPLPYYLGTFVVATLTTYGHTAYIVPSKVLPSCTLFQTSERLGDFINATQSSKANKVLAARRLRCRDILVTTDSKETESLIEKDDRWTKVIADMTKVRGQRFTIMAHAVRTN